MKIKILLVSSLFVLLAGCASQKEKIVKLDLKYMTTGSVPVKAVDKQAQSQLAEAASSVGKSLQTLSAIQIATHPTLKMPKPVNPEAIGMAQISSINWTGPIVPLLHKIAKSSKYRLRVIGKQPAIPAIVSINAQDEPLANILRDATYQIAKKATVKVYPVSHTIELRYFK